MLDDDAVADAAQRLLAAERSREPIHRRGRGRARPPANGVAWLANKLAPHDEFLTAGQVILAGSFTRPVFVSEGDVIHADFGGLGAVICRFR